MERVTERWANCPGDLSNAQQTRERGSNKVVIRTGWDDVFVSEFEGVQSEGDGIFSTTGLICEGGSNEERVTIDCGDVFCL